MRILFTLLLTAGVVFANGAPPPQPPTGKKTIPVDVSVILDKEVKGYVLYSNIYQGDRERLDVNSEKAMPVPRDLLTSLIARHGTVVFAVPEVLEAKLKKAEEWDKVPKEDKARILQHKFDGFAFVDKSDKRERLAKTYLIKSVDAKGGIKAEEVKDDQKDEPKKPLAFTEPGALVGGIALALSVTLGGLWLARRRK